MFTHRSILDDSRCVFCALTSYKTQNEIVKYTILHDRKINELHNDVIEYIILLRANKKCNNKKDMKEKKLIKTNNKHNYFITLFELKEKLNKL